MCCISENFDLKYVAEKQTIELELAQVVFMRGMIEESYIMEVGVEPPVSRSYDDSTSIISCNRSGLLRLTVDHSDLYFNGYNY